MGYAELKEIYNRGERIQYFNMAICHLMDIGFQTAKEITDEQIKEVEGNSFVIKEFCEWMLITAREIATCCSPVALIQFCQVEDLYAVPEGLSKKDMKKIIRRFIEYDTRSLKTLVKDGIVEPEDLEGLGYWTEDEVNEYYEEEYV